MAEPEPTPTPTPTPPPAPWHVGKLEGELLGHAQTKGWDKLDAATAAFEAIKSQRESEKMIGVPADKVLKIADPKDLVASKAMWERLGAPKDAAGYDFSEIKTADGKPAVADKLADAIRAEAAATFAPKDVVTRITAAVVKAQNDIAMETKAVADAALVTEKAALAKNWGANDPANKFIAGQAAAKLGVGAEAIAALEKVVGYAKVMEMFLNIGTKIGEARFVETGAPGGGVMSREQAMSTKADRLKDSAFTGRFLAGGSAEVREMQALDTLIAG